MTKLISIIFFCFISCRAYSQHNIYVQTVDRYNNDEVLAFSSNEVNRIGLYKDNKKTGWVTLWKDGNSENVKKYKLDKLFFNVKLFPISSDITDISNNSFSSDIIVRCEKNIKNEIQLGICYSSKNENPTISDDTTSIKGKIENVYKITAKDLQPYKKYYYRGFCILKDEVFYGNVRSTTTLEEDKDFGDMFVDLGLPSGLLWATCNVGANKPEDLGDLYAWGETETKDISEFDWDHYKFKDPNCEDNVIGYPIKYLSDTDRSTILDADDDVVRVKYGGQCRMPSYCDFNELYTKCNWEWVTNNNGVAGYVVTGHNNKSIFLPYGGDLGYWSNELNSGLTNNRYAYVLVFSSDYIKYYFNEYRWSCNIIRPVMQKKIINH